MTDNNAVIEPEIKTSHMWRSYCYYEFPLGSDFRKRPDVDGPIYNKINDVYYRLAGTNDQPIYACSHDLVWVIE